MKNKLPENQLSLTFDLPASENSNHNPVTIDEISALFWNVFRIYQNRSKKLFAPLRMDVSFYPYRSLKHTLRYSGNAAQVKISHFTAKQPAEYFELLAHRLWSDLFRMKCPGEYRRRFDEMEIRIDRGLRGNGLYPRKINKIGGKGGVYDLDSMLTSITREYDFGLIGGLRIGWSPNQARRRLGYYDIHSKTIVISGILDHPEVPDYVVEFIVYHELLHHIIPSDPSTRKKKFHGSFFRRWEKKFREYVRAELWLKEEYPEWLNRQGRVAKKRKKKS